MKQEGYILGVSHVDAEYNCLSAWDVAQVGLKDQVVARWHTDGFLDISPVVLDLVEANSTQVNISPHPNATNGNQFTLFNGLTQRETMSRVLKNLESRCPVSAIGSRRQPECELGSEVTKKLLISFASGVVRLVDDEVAKGVGSELIQVAGYALHCSGDIECVDIVAFIKEQARLNFGPMPMKLQLGLIDQRLSVRHEQCSLRDPTCVCNCRNRFPRSLRMGYQGDRVPARTKVSERLQRVFLVWA